MKTRWDRLISTGRGQVIAIAGIIVVTALVMLGWAAANGRFSNGGATSSAVSDVTVGAIGGPDAAGDYTVAVTIDNSGTAVHSYIVEVRLQDGTTGTSFGTYPVIVNDLGAGQSYTGSALFTTGDQAADAVIVSVDKS